MKNKTPSLFAALLVGLMANVLLRTQTAYWTRTGWAAGVLSVPLLACAGWLFARCWRAGECAVFRYTFAAILAGSSVLELLRLWQLGRRLYPGTTTLTAVCLMLLLPVIYLRRVSAISQTANVLLCLLIAAGGVMLLSILPQLRVQNLQMEGITLREYGDAVGAQLYLYPEYLLPALWPEQDKRGSHTVGKLSLFAVLFDVAVHSLLELYFGAGMPGQTDPLHAAARSGSLSVFNRLEWIQLALWAMAISLKLALYLYSIIRLCGGRQGAQRNTAVGLDRYPLYFGGMLLCCVLLRKIDIQQAISLRNGLLWGFASVVWIGGSIAWLMQRPKRS